jgi:hypothetical protein
MDTGQPQPESSAQGAFISPPVEDYPNETDTHRVLMFNIDSRVGEVWAATAVVAGSDEEKVRNDEAMWTRLRDGLFRVAGADAGGKQMRLTFPKPPAGHTAVCYVQARVIEPGEPPVVTEMQIVQAHPNAQGLLVQQMMRFFGGMLANLGDLHVEGIAANAVTVRTVKDGHALQMVLTATVQNGEPVLHSEIFRGEAESVNQQASAYIAGIR